MPNMFIGKGNLVDSPSLKKVRVGNADKSVADMRVFFDEFGKNAAGEIVQTGGFFMSVAQWGKKGEEAVRLLRKGARVKVEGRLEQFFYKPKVEGDDPVPGFQIVADDISLALTRVEHIEFKAKREVVEEGAEPSAS